MQRVPCGLIYSGLTSKKREVRIREHVHEILRAATSGEEEILEPVPKHFKAMHGCDASLLRIRRIDKVYRDGGGGGSLEAETCTIGGPMDYES